MENKNFLKVHNINLKRRSQLALDPNDLIFDLLENKINENQLINNCISGTMHEKARPLVWTILLNLIPLNKPEEWIFYFQKFSELHKNKIHKCLKIKETNIDAAEEDFDYEEIVINDLRLVNNENIQKSNFTHLKSCAKVKVSSSMTSLDNESYSSSNNIKNKTNKKEISVEEKTECQEDKKFNHAAVDKNPTIIGAEMSKLLNMNFNDSTASKNNYTSNLNEKRDLALTNINSGSALMKSHCEKIISEAAYEKNSNKVIRMSKEEAPIFELISKKPTNKANNFYSFYANDKNLSIEMLNKENSEISEASNIIKLDIERTFQEIDLFKTTETKEILCKTLFIWYCDNTDLGYKQGMNEILATIFYAAFSISKPIFERMPNMQNEKEIKHKEILNLIESEDFFQMTLYALFDQILALGVKSIYNYHNFAEAKEFAYSEEKSNFEFVREEINEMVKDLNNNKKNMQKINKDNNISSNKNENENVNKYNLQNDENQEKINNGILEKSDFEFINKLSNNNNNNTEKKVQHKFFNFENFSSYLLNKKERAKKNINNSFKSIKDFILKRPWDYKKSSNNQQQPLLEKNKYKQDENNNQAKKINFKIFESENMDRCNLEEILQLEQSDLRRRVNIIFFYYLKSYDPELYNHLLYKIDPYIIVFRWILCLFNREISLKYVLYIWDCIFAIEFHEKNSASFVKSFQNKPYRNVINNFNFVNFICVSIFEDMKNELLQEDEACYVLQMLMHFPNEKNVKEIVKRALKIRKIIYEKLQIKNEYVFID